eukprot:5711919-Pyramimonas_sp.AAC.1
MSTVKKGQPISGGGGGKRICGQSWEGGGSSGSCRGGYGGGVCGGGHGCEMRTIWVIHCALKPLRCSPLSFLTSTRLPLPST